MSAKPEKVSLYIQPDLMVELRAYGAAAGHRNLSETCRELMAEGLYAKTEGKHASAVRRAVREELDAFTAEEALRMSLLASDIAVHLENALSDRLDSIEVVSRAGLLAASEAASASDASGRTPAEVRADAVDGIWETWSETDRAAIG